MHFLVHYRSSNIAFMKLKLGPSARQERFSRFVMLSGDQTVKKPHKMKQKFVRRNFEKGPFETMTCLNSSFWKHFQSFYCIQVWKWEKHIFNMSSFSRWQENCPTDIGSVNSILTTGQGCLCISVWSKCLPTLSAHTYQCLSFSFPLTTLLLCSFLQSPRPGIFKYDSLS